MAKATVLLLFAVVLFGQSQSVSLVGGWKEGDVTNKETQHLGASLATLALDDLEAKSNNLYARRVLEITGIQTKVSSTFYELCVTN